MIDTILNAVFSFIINLVNLLLTPIDALIETFLPDLSQAVSSVSSFLNVLSHMLPDHILPDWNVHILHLVPPIQSSFSFPALCLICFTSQIIDKLLCRTSGDSTMRKFPFVRFCAQFFF